MPEPHSPASRRTPLADVHESLGATMTDFAGWLMPLRYAGETREHVAVRTAAGLFDLSHMGELFVTGPDAAAALDYALVGQASVITPGRAKYSMICTVDGGIVDDLVVYRLADDEFLVVANAANATSVAAELAERAAHFDASIADRTHEYALIAIQGPRAAAILSGITDAALDELRYYASQRAVVAQRDVLLARTGYTGEDGFELYTDPADAPDLWQALAAAGKEDGLVPAGLAARDSLRLEAGMPLYGNELSRDVTPYDAGLGRVVKLDKEGGFVGRDALAKRAQQASPRLLVGLVSQTKRVPRHGYPVLCDGQPCGSVTSGGPSPTLGRPIAMAYVDAAAARPAEAEPEGPTGENSPADDPAAPQLAVDIRGTAEPAVLVPLPFYRRSDLN